MFCVYSARPGRPPKRSALAMTPDGLDKLKKNRIQMASDFYSPAASASLIGGKCVLDNFLN